MKVIVAGGRGSHDYEFIASKLTHYLQNLKDVEIVQGGAKGVDFQACMYATRWSLPHKQFDAEWDKYGKAAGPLRNKAMAEYADALIAFWDGKSPGTKNMIDTARSLGLSVRVVRIDQ